MSDFIKIKNSVAKQFKRMSEHQLFRVDVSKDKLWETYLSSFPEGSNPIYKERTHHDCNCCKQFIRAVGDVVAIIDGKMESIWDGIVDDPAYNTVSQAMSALVLSKPIINKFYHFEKQAGTDNTKQMLDGSVIQWNHFFVNIPAKYVLPNADIASKLGEIRSSYDVMKRSLDEIDTESINTVLELISQNSLYRGEEHKFVVTEFKKLKTNYSKLKDADKPMFVWNAIDATQQSIVRIRNTVIGTLLTDIADGVDLEDAVKMFESKVAPTNYKRPSALITEGMIKKAKEKINELGLTSALARRYSVMTDIKVNNILFANRESKNIMSGDVFDELIEKKSKTVKSMDTIEEISIEKFISDVLPNITSIEALFENKHSGNLVSLVSPEDPTAGNLFKWNNNFSWSYNGEVTDSIKERVKAAGGSIEGDLCCRLAWDYSDDLDFHMYEPDGNRIYFGNRRETSRCGGMLDVDANGADGVKEFPVENIFYKNKSKMKEGEYKLVVNNYYRRSGGTGFQIEIEADGVTHSINYEKVVRQGENVNVAKIHYSKTNGFTIKTDLPTTQTSKNMWNLPTQSFHNVNLMMLSPNHWDGENVGNKHYFFILDKCNNPESTRGFYNEFLKSELDVHRKVFEVVGSKMKTPESDEQLSGLGFSSTQKNSLVVKVKGSFTRSLKINFN